MLWMLEFGLTEFKEDCILYKDVCKNVLLNFNMIWHKSYRKKVVKPTAKTVFEQILTHSLSEGFLKNYLPVILQTIAAWSQESFKSFLHSLCMHNMKYIQMFSFLLSGITFWQMLLFLNASNNDFMLLSIDYFSDIFAIIRLLIVRNPRFSCYKLRKYLILVLNI